MDSRLAEMFEELANARPEVRPSEMWMELNRRNLDQLETNGYENFKRTIATNYFTWVSGFRDPNLSSQTLYLLKHISPVSIPGIAVRAFFTEQHALFSKRWSQQYNLLTRLLWAYASTLDREQALAQLAEPEEGNPPRVYDRGKLISQDLANSFIEFNAMTSGIPAPGAVKTILELGAGYGRTAFVFLRLMPHIRYIIADIPPALYVAERYLSSQFSQRRIFKFRKFSRYADISDEFENAEIALLLPHQLELLPDKTADLFVNISSLHEMRLDQIDYYFRQIDRLTRQYFYFKQWKVSQNSLDHLKLGEKDYPIPQHWSPIYWRECRVQTYFFEALLALEDSHVP